jgi:hypothetical protein
MANVQKVLRAGDNVLAVHGSNDGGVAGLVLRMQWSTGDQRGELAQRRRAGVAASDDPDGWNNVGLRRPRRGPKVTVLAALGAQTTRRGVATLGEDGLGSAVPPDAPQAAVAAVGLQGPLARDALKLLAVPRAYGSWVALCADDQRPSLRERPGAWALPDHARESLGELTTLERVDVDLAGCHGLCWFRGALYAVVSSRQSGLYRLTDGNGDGKLDKVELLTKIEGDGEHGPHAVVPAPDGQNLLVMCGNHTNVPPLAASRVPTNWGEDRLIEKIEDPNGHAVGIKAPGGFVCLVDPDGKRWEMYCCGFRNAYDLAVLDNGDIVTYDSDMEWDMGLPWYRPTRLYQVLSGVDYGWRSGTSTWPTDYPEAPPALVDVGPGSPTGLVAVGNQVLALDWTFGTVYGLVVTAGPGGLKGTMSTQLTGVPLPVTDIVAVGDCCYVLTGGRGIPSTLLRTRNPGVWSAVVSDATASAQRNAFESRHGRAERRDVTPVLQQLGQRDAVGIAARLALESQPSWVWGPQVLAVDAARPGASLQGLLALARAGTKEDLQSLLEALGKFSFAALSHEHRIWWLRIHAIALLRQGPANDAQRALLAQRLLPLFPAKDDRLDAELAELLATVDAPGFVDAAVPLLSPMRPAAPPSWADVVVRNASYGGVIQKMLEHMPPIGQIAIANALRAVPRGWTLDQRRAYFTFLTEAARKQKGGASYDGYLKAFIDAAWQRVLARRAAGTRRARWQGEGRTAEVPEHACRRGLAATGSSPMPPRWSRMASPGRMSRRAATCSMHSAARRATTSPAKVATTGPT